MSIFCMNVASLLGLAVAIDYALFIVARFREELHSGGTVEEAVAQSVRPALRFFGQVRPTVGRWLEDNQAPTFTRPFIGGRGQPGPVTGASRTTPCSQHANEVQPPHRQDRLRSRSRRRIGGSIALFTARRKRHVTSSGSRAAPSSFVNTCPESTQVLAPLLCELARGSGVEHGDGAGPAMAQCRALRSRSRGPHSRVQHSMGQRREVWATRSGNDILKWRLRADPRLHDRRCGDRPQTRQRVIDREGGWTHAQPGSAPRRGPDVATAHFSSTS